MEMVTTILDFIFQRRVAADSTPVRQSFTISPTPQQSQRHLLIYSALQVVVMVPTSLQHTFRGSHLIL
jgi:hypothetical protein